MAGELAIDLVNSYALDPGYAEPELLRSPGELEVLLRRHGLAWTGTIGEAELDAARQLRGRLRRLFEDEALAERTEGLATLVAGARVQVRLDGGRVSSALAAPTDQFGEWLATEASLGLLAFLEAHGYERLGVCQASPCRDVYADATHNRSRRYCSDRCSNRVHSAAHRRRQRSATPVETTRQPKAAAEPLP